MDWKLIVNILIAILGFYVVIFSLGKVFFRNRTKYNLALLIILTMMLAAFVMDLVLPGKVLFSGMQNSLVLRHWYSVLGILLYVLLGGSFIGLLLYPDFNRRFRRWKLKGIPEWKELNDAAAETDAIFEDNLNKYPRDIELLSKYTYFLWINRKEYDKAEEYFNKTIALTNKYSYIYRAYAVFLKNIRKNYEKAEEYYLKALKIDPRDASNLSSYAEFLWEVRKDYSKAEEYLKQAVKQYPKNANYVFNYAHLMEYLKNNDKAEEYYLKAIKLDPQNASNLSSYAYFIWRAKRDYSKAEEFLHKAIQQNPNNAIDLFNYADLLERRNDYAKAEEYYKRSLILDPENASHLCNYARVLILLKNFDKAKTVLKQAFVSNKEDTDDELELELRFYAFAIFPEDFPESEAKIEGLLVQNVYSPGLYLKDILERAKEKGHPNFDKLAELERKITTTSESNNTP